MKGEEFRVDGGKVKFSTLHQCGYLGAKGIYGCKGMSCTMQMRSLKWRAEPPDIAQSLADWRAGFGFGVGSLGFRVRS